MNVEEINLAFTKNIRFAVEPTISAYIQLPAGVHVIGGKKYTVSEYTQNEGTENAYTTTVIDSMEDVSETQPTV